MKIANIFYNVIIGLVIALAVLLVVSKLPIPGNYKVLTVLSGSMEPAIHTGAVVVIKPSGEYNIGDVITFGETGKDKTPITHRINNIYVKDGKPVFVTKGDANNSTDMREIGKEEIQGKVLFSIPFLGYVLEFVKTPLGFGVVVILPAAAIIIDEAIKIFKEFKKKPESGAMEPEKE